MNEKIAFGCDHVGFILKHEIVAHLVERGVEVIDKGTGRQSVLIIRITPVKSHWQLLAERLMAGF